MEQPATTTTDTPTATASRAVVPRFLDDGARWAWRFLVVSAAVVVLVWLTVRLTVVIIPVVVALVLTALLGPVVERLARVVPRLLATWLVLLTTMALLVGLGFALSSPITDAVDNVSGEVDTAVGDLQEWLQDGPLGLSADTVESLSRSVARTTDRAGSGLLAEPGSTVRLVVEILGGFFLMLVLLFFFLKEGRQLWAWLLDRIRPVRRATIDASGRAAMATLQGWIRGVAITGLVDGLLIGGAMLVLGVPAALPVAVLTVFASFFPIVGATLAGVLAVAIALTAGGLTTAIIMGVVVLVVQQVEGNVILPLVMRRQVSLHPIVILGSLAVGGAMGGILGALVAVPLTAAGSAAISKASEFNSHNDAVDTELFVTHGGSITLARGGRERETPLSTD
ncbi:MAG TPA: AI-2E family transporter [Ilumatobacteraceae bacterium]|nr:AI-2E family transporter [Ilumatobacteraceae bacterium]